MTRKLVLLLGAAAVFALIIGLVLAVRGTTADGARRTDKEPVAAEPRRPAAPVATEPGAAPTPTATAPTRTPSSSPAEPIVAEPPPRQPGDAVVHDHRGQPASGKPSFLAPQTVANVRRAVRPALDSCKSQAPAGTNLQFSVQVGVHASGGRLTVGDLVLHGAEALGESYKTCLSNALASVTATAADGQADGQQNMVFAARVP